MPHGYSSIPKESDEDIQTRSKNKVKKMRTLAVSIFLGFILLTFFIISFSSHSSSPSSSIYSAKGLKRLKRHPTGAAEGCAVDVMVMRHCEKGTLRAHCTKEGLKRAEFLPTLFGDTKDERWPTPLALFARPPEGKRGVMREIELLTPLSESIGVPIQSKGYEINNKIEMVEDIFNGISSGEWCGGVVVVSWKHENIPKLTNQLGCGPLQGCPEHYPVHEFDSIISIRYLFSTPEFSSKKSGKIEKGPIWTVSGSVQKMGFDIVAEDKKARLAAGGV
ncbi:hypothetical protein TrCOL_g10209 [Triparma columacea]|uniref:Uncharacterized protein n=1 Tax=Triparma columacea TaxID=722753 RepID=A0A9W7L861_9STRA|nr:hypothetical protein TrCOL_g10209 [Triparma columacea]